MDKNLTIKWLGISGVEVGLGEERILIDPVFSRIRFTRTLLGHIEPDADAVQRQAEGCRGIFITHAHHDHLMDAPMLSRLTGDAVYGSPNACAVAAACGAENGRLHAIGPGSTVEAGPFTVTALLSEHIRLPGFGYGEAHHGLTPPLRARQYRMDENFVFLVLVGGYRLLIGPGLCTADPGRVDALLCCPIYLGKKLPEYVGGLHPRVFLPIHWENMFRPDDGHPRPGMLPAFPPHRLDVRAVARQVALLGVRYVQPEIRRQYLLEELLQQ